LIEFSAKKNSYHIAPMLTLKRCVAQPMSSEIQYFRQRRHSSTLILSIRVLKVIVDSLINYRYMKCQNGVVGSRN